MVNKVHKKLRYLVFLYIEKLSFFYIYLFKSAPRSNSINRSFQATQKIELLDRKVLIVVSHCDDELIWSSSLLTQKDSASVRLLVIYSGGKKRDDSACRVAHQSGVEFDHLKLEENTFSDNRLAFITNEAAEKIENKLNTYTDIDIVFTHNPHGEYGHGHHIDLSAKISKFYKNREEELFYFGYAHSTVYNKLALFYKTTTLFLNHTGVWPKYSTKSVKPSSGMLKFKQYERYFLVNHTHYFPQKDQGLLYKLIENYEFIRKDIWDGWLRYGTHYHKYMVSNVQYFMSNKVAYNFEVFLEWPTFYKTDLLPKNKQGEIVRADDIRYLFDYFLIPKLKFEGDLLFCGWNEFCINRRYKSKFLKYCSSFSTLDNNPIRKDESIYGDQVATYVGDIVNLDGVIEDSKFDSIVCNGVFEYVSDIEASTAEISRILKVGGRFLLGMPGKEYSSTGVNRTTYTEMKKILRSNGLLPVQVWLKEFPEYYFIHGIKLDESWQLTP